MVITIAESCQDLTVWNSGRFWRVLLFFLTTSYRYMWYHIGYINSDTYRQSEKYMVVCGHAYSNIAYPYLVI